MEAKPKQKASSSTLKIELLVALFFCAILSCSTASENSPSSIPKNVPFLYVLGVAQDAGYPQAGQQSAWQQVKTGEKEIKFASSLALIDPVSQERWLFDATPDFKQQLALVDDFSTTAQYPFDGIFLTHGHMGHYTGLMHLGREAMNSQEVPVYAMPRMAQFLTQNGPWSQLIALHNIRINTLSSGQKIQLNERLSVTPLLVPHRDEFTETVGFIISSGKQQALFIPDIDKWGKWTESIVDWVKQVDYALLDATFYNERELKGRSMAEIPHPLVEESMQLFKDMPTTEKQKIHFIHINNSNPLLWSDSPEHEEVLKSGFQVGYRGKVLTLRP